MAHSFVDLANEWVATLLATPDRRSECDGGGRCVVNRGFDSLRPSHSRNCSAQIVDLGGPPGLEITQKAGLVGLGKRISKLQNAREFVVGKDGAVHAANA